MTMKAQILQRLWARSDPGERRALEGRLKEAGLLYLLQDSGTERPEPTASLPVEERQEILAGLPQDLRDAFEERAAIRQYLGGYPCAEAEEMAANEILPRPGRKGRSRELPEQGNNGTARSE